MSVPMIPIALPIGASDEAIRDTYLTDGGFDPAFSTLSFTVPGGECWLAESVFSDTQLGSGGEHRIRCAMFDLDNRKVCDMWSETIFATGDDPTVHAGLNLTLVSYHFVPFTNGGVSIANFPLPWVIMMPGWVLEFGIQLAQGGVDYFEAGANLRVTKWELSGRRTAQLEQPVVTPKIP